MAGRYGMSFAKGLIEKGDYDEAVAAATQEIEGGQKGPEPYFDRATAYDLLERYADAVSDFEAALRINAEEKELDPFTLDDAYFSALVSSAQAERSVPAAVALVARYREVLPAGEHVAESHTWEKRLRGELPSLLDKTRGVEG